MCTAIKDGALFGRTLDLECSLGEQVVIIPRGYPLTFKYDGEVSEHYAMVGMAYVKREVPLLFDAVNEHGVAMAALNFKGFAVYTHAQCNKRNLASFELIPRLLGSCASAKEALNILESVNVTDDAFDDELKPSPLHWILADKSTSYTVESTGQGLCVYENPLGVLTNAPEFPFHLYNTANYMALSPEPPKNRLAPKNELDYYSRGMGAFGLPGDFSSASRFVRAVYVKNHALKDSGDECGTNRFFHIMDAVSQPLGCVLTDDSKPVYTVYTSCMKLESSEYLYTTYSDRRIKSIKLSSENTKGTAVILY